MHQITVFLEKKYVVMTLAIVFAVFLLPVPFSILPWLTDAGPTWFGIDCSFQITMNYALRHHMSWGDELIATYGPLAFLSNRVMWGVPKVYALLFDLFMLFNFACVFKNFISGNNKIFAVFFLLIAILLLNVHPGSTTSFLVFFFALYWMYDYVRKPGIISVILSCLCAVLCFYIKLNTGIFAIVILFAHLLNLYAFHKISKRHLLFALLLTVVLLYVPSVWFNVNLVEYIRSGLYTMSGYNDMMYLNEKHHALAELWIWLSCTAMVLYYVYRIWRLYRDGEKYRIFYTLMTLLYIFFAWKQSILRNDFQHISEFFGSAVMVLFLENINAESKAKTFLRYVPVTIIVLFLFAGKLNLKPLGTLVVERFTAPADYVRDYRVADKKDYLAEIGKRYIPSDILEEIGSETIDVFPWDVEYLVQNKLNYLPRPDFQSYAVYNRFLQDANYESYIHHPPAFILYDYDAIDERYPFNDEGITNAYIAANYSLADTFTSNGRLRLLLKRTSKAAPLQVKEVRRFQVNINDQVDVSEFDFVRISLSRSIMGKLGSLLYKPSKLRIHYIPHDGIWRSYRTSPGQLETFVYTKKFVENTKDFIRLINQKQELMNVTAIRLEDSAAAFGSEVMVTGFKFENQADERIQYLNHLSFPVDKQHDYNGKKVAALWNGIITSSPVYLSQGTYTMTINTKGTPLAAVYPHLNVLINDRKISDFYASENFTSYSFDFTIEKREKAAISIQMDNDANNVKTGEDRNLFLDWITITKK